MAPRTLRTSLKNSKSRTLSEVIEGFERRRQQEEMAGAVLYVAFGVYVANW